MTDKRVACNCRKCQEERDALRAENERLQTDNELFRREADRLTLADRQWADHVKRLAEEKERLRTVLRKICLLDGEPDALSQIFDVVHREIESWLT